MKNQKKQSEKFIMVTYEFGDPIYIAPLKNMQIQVTADKEAAEIWNTDDTKSSAKLAYHKAATGYKELKFELA